MEQAVNIIKWFIIIVLVVHFTPIIIHDGIPFAMQQAKILTVTTFSF